MTPIGDPSSSKNEPIGAIALVAAWALFSPLGCAATWLPGDVAIQRAAREFSCPPPKISIVQRSDVADSVFDLAACGQRVRYSCLLDGAYAEGAIYTDSPYRCIREPDPAKWDPDPTLIASLPQPQVPLSLRSSPGEARRICRDPEDYIWSSEPEYGSLVAKKAPKKRSCVLR